MSWAKPFSRKDLILLQPKLDTYPLPRPGTYPRGAGTPIKDFFFLFNKDIFSENRVFLFQYGGRTLVMVSTSCKTTYSVQMTFWNTATDQYKPRYAGSRRIPKATETTVDRNNNNTQTRKRTVCTPSNCSNSTEVDWSVLRSALASNFHVIPFDPQENRSHRRVWKVNHRGLL